MILLDVRDLDVEYGVRGSIARAVRGVRFSLGDGQNLGIVGESGCGKTTLAKAIMNLLPRNGRVTRGEVVFKGTNLVGLSQAQMRPLRWKHISMIPQSAMNTLDPVYRVRDQLCEAILAHERIPRSEAVRKSMDLAALVGLEGKRLLSYPHQLSGGMKQRSAIAMALALNPSLIIADEPTTALDVITQDRILAEIKELQHRLKFSMIYISHDIGIIAETCDTMAVMYAGRVVEYGPTKELFANTFHPYTLGLKNAFPSLRNEHKLVAVPGFPSSLIGLEHESCMFKPRCPFATEVCGTDVPPTVEVTAGHLVSCFRVEDAGAFRQVARDQATWLRSASGEVA